MFRRITRAALVVGVGLLLLGAARPALAQANCVAGGTYTDGSGHVMYCTGNGTAQQMPWSTDVSGGLPSGMIAFIATGTCPTGWTEVTALDGKMIRGTVAANGNVGTTGGSDSYTPAGTISALTFVGTPFTAVINHTHPIVDPGHNHTQNSFAPRIINSGTAGTVGVQGASGASNANASNAATTATNQSATTGISTSNPAGGVTSITPAGTIATPTLSGTPATVVPAYVLLIACSKN